MVSRETLGKDGGGGGRINPAGQNVVSVDLGTERTDETYCLRGVTAQGNEVWYTGRAGERWVSDQYNEGFTYQSHERAHNRAKAFNAYVTLHGVWFTVASVRTVQTVVIESAAQLDELLNLPASAVATSNDSRPQLRVIQTPAAPSATAACGRSNECGMTLPTALDPRTKGGR